MGSRTPYPAYGQSAYYATAPAAAAAPGAMGAAPASVPSYAAGRF